MQIKTKPKYELNGEMRTEAENKDNGADGIQRDEVEVGPERFDISGSLRNPRRRLYLHHEQPHQLRGD